MPTLFPNPAHVESRQSSTDSQVPSQPPDLIDEVHNVPEEVHNVTGKVHDEPAPEVGDEWASTSNRGDDTFDDIRGKFRNSIMISIQRFFMFLDYFDFKVFTRSKAIL